MCLALTSGTLAVAQRKRLRLQRLLANIWWVSKGVLVLTLCVALMYGSYTAYNLMREADYFRLRTIVIRGQIALSQQDILYLLALPAQVSLFDLDLARMGARLERHPQLKTVTLRRQFPDTLTVTVQERVPALVVVSDGQHVVVDSEGVVLRPMASAQDKALPQLLLHHPRVLAPGMSLRQAEVQRALDLMQAYQTSPVADALRVVSLTVEDSGASRWTVTPDAFILRVGEGQIASQLQRLPPVLRYIRQHGLPVQTVDISYRQRVVVIPGSS
jgi:cell division protein FtsQ